MTTALKAGVSGLSDKSPRKAGGKVSTGAENRLKCWEILDPSRKERFFDFGGK